MRNCEAIASKRFAVAGASARLVIPLMGMYLASAGYVFGALAWQKRGAFVFSGVAAIGTAFALYLIFELTFQISLPRGLLGDIAGF